MVKCTKLVTKFLQVQKKLTVIWDILFTAFMQSKSSVSIKFYKTYFVQFSHKVCDFLSIADWLSGAQGSEQGLYTTLLRSMKKPNWIHYNVFHLCIVFNLCKFQFGGLSGCSSKGFIKM